MVFVAWVFALVGCSGQAEYDDDQTRGWSAEMLYQHAQELLEKGDFAESATYFQRVIIRYPFDLLAQQSQLDLIYAHYRDEAYDLAIMAADRFIRMNPTHTSVDYAWYMKGVASISKNESTVGRFFALDLSKRCQASIHEAFDAFRTLLKRYPESRYANEARRKMAQIRDDLARQEMNVARFYFERGATIAAIQRAHYVLENYQQTPSVYDALVLLAGSYRELGNDQLYQDTVRIIQLNFPESKEFSDGS
jgi:outer membrane protein assembly factor BamD